MLRLNDDRVWTAIENRDRALDGVVVYAVRTTGIYCRPSCAARKPKRKNVVLFDSPDEAEEAGFRACHRCRPKSLNGTTTEYCLQRAARYLRTHLDENITLSRLGEAVGVSPYYLQRKFREMYGLSPREYQNAQRLERMKTALKDGREVGPAVWEAGFGSTRAAYQAARDGLGMTPATYGDGGRGIDIQYALGEVRFGRALIGWTGRGVCAVFLGEDDTSLIDELNREFPRARVQACRGDQEALLADVLRQLDQETPRVGIPLDLQGTSFQLRVWKALRQIPAGEVRSYGQVAASIGRPGAARAVARACAANRTALLVPCHRVVRADGEAGGYRWGVERKRQILEAEGSPMGDRG